MLATYKTIYTDLAGAHLMSMRSISSPSVIAQSGSSLDLRSKHTRLSTKRIPLPSRHAFSIHTRNCARSRRSKLFRYISHNCPQSTLPFHSRLQGFQNTDCERPACPPRLISSALLANALSRDAVSSHPCCIVYRQRRAAAVLLWQLR